MEGVRGNRASVTIAYSPPRLPSRDGSVISAAAEPTPGQLHHHPAHVHVPRAGDPVIVLGLPTCRGSCETEG